MDELTKLWAALIEYVRKAADLAAQELAKLWAIILEHLNSALERVQALPAEQLRPAAALACGALVVMLILWVRALRKLRKTRQELAQARARCETLQAQYDAEVKWRTATERVEAAQSPAPSPLATPQPATPPTNPPPNGVSTTPSVAAPASTVRVTASPQTYDPGAAGPARSTSNANPNRTS